MESNEAVLKYDWTYTPMGDRILVDDIESTISLEERGRLSGLTVITNQVNRPKVTQGRVLALGDDPTLPDRVQVGDIVMFHHMAGSETWLEGQRFRTLEMHEVTGRLKRRAPGSQAQELAASNTNGADCETQSGPS